MAFTIFCKKSESFPAQCFGVFDTAVLAERHARRHLRHRSVEMMVINEPLQPENMLSLDLLRKSANFALTTLRNPEKAKKENYIGKCINELELALHERPEPEIVTYRFRLHTHDHQTMDTYGVNEEQAVLQRGYPQEIAADWRNQFRLIENRGSVSQ